MSALLYRGRFFPLDSVRFFYVHPQTHLYTYTCRASFTRCWRSCTPQQATRTAARPTRAGGGGSTVVVVKEGMGMRRRRRRSMRPWWMSTRRGSCTSRRWTWYVRTYVYMYMHPEIAHRIHPQPTQRQQEKRKFRFLAPCPGALPSRYLVLGSVVWVEGT